MSVKTKKVTKLVLFGGHGCTVRYLGTSQLPVGGCPILHFICAHTLGGVGERGSFCVEFICSPHVFLGERAEKNSLEKLWVKKRKEEKKNIKEKKRFSQ